ncbi:hypothetical protein H5410_012394 [Solanum commersonii]|uniref:Uncharacterized protein n=1 Tax=Solanum commersonii TaxID=4109 RepID=A0A9J6ARC8_SOLCO|nr:hypothetical protein H5410_012394 [Solanum commersonii]
MEVKPGRGEFHENPTTSICAHSEMDIGAATISARRDIGEVIDGQVGEEEQEWYDAEYTANALEIQ